jgi:hypothetical protein
MVGGATPAVCTIIMLEQELVQGKFDRGGRNWQNGARTGLYCRKESIALHVQNFGFTDVAVHARDGSWRC